MCSGGELFDKIIEKQYYKEDEAKIVMRQIIEAIAHCHSKGICDRD